MLRSIPFLLVDGDCAEAMGFYHRCLGGELTLTRLCDTPMRDTLPAEKHDTIFNARLTGSGIEISATDWMASPERGVFDRLRDGEHDERLQELHEMPFGWYGQFYDRWIFRSDTSSAGGGR
jgi:PhnB protein